MKTATISAALSVAVLSYGTLGAVTLKLSKTHGATTVSKRHILPRQNVYLELLNNVTGGSYAAQVTVGTPPQEQNLAIDTGSSDVWFLDSEAPLCTDRDLVAYYGGCSSSFDTSRSSSFQMAEEGRFNISYLDGSGAAGDYILDDINVGGETVKSQQLGLAHDVTVTTGIMGIGFTENVASNSGRNDDPFTYPSIIDQMFDQGIINLKAYSLYLDAKSSDTGSIIFGGMDSGKWIGELFQLPLVPSEYPNGTEVYDHFTVVMTSLSMSNDNGNTSFTSNTYRVPVVLDSGTTLTYLPEVTTRRIYTEIDAVDDSENSGLVYCDCAIGDDPSVTFNYEFGDSRSAVEIRVPISELLYSLEEIFGSPNYRYYLPDLPFQNACAFGIFPASSGVSILGDTFLRSAYVVYDLTNKIVAMAQTNFNSTQDNILDFEADATSIPRASGVASGLDVTQTATGILGGGNGGRPTARPTESGSSTGSGSSAGNPGVVTVTASPSATSTGAGIKLVPGLDISGLAVLGVSGLFAVIGGGWFLA